ncbi:hypothetical protein D9M68_736660 [compost metagenome]
MTDAFAEQVTMNLIRDQPDIALQAYFTDFTQFCFCPDPASRVMGIAEDEYFNVFFRIIQLLYDIFKTQFIITIQLYQRAVINAAVVNVS